MADPCPEDDLPCSECPSYCLAAVYARCTCGMARQERAGHAPQHEEWCEVSDD